MRKPFIVAEMGANHGGSRGRAFELVRAAADCGADAIKIQTFTPEQMADDRVLESGPWAGKTTLELYRRAHTPREWHRDIFELARGRCIVPFASVFHPDDVDFLETLGCAIYKIASFELTDLPLIAHAAATGKPLIISTGMATEEEITNAVRTVHEAGGFPAQLTLLKCTSAYPASPEDANLAAMCALGRWHHEFGLSDHTQGIAVPVAATALGASVIEKHLKADGSTPTLDEDFSLTPWEFKEMVQACRTAARAIGQPTFGPVPAEAPSQMLRRPPGGKRGDVRSTDTGEVNGPT